jgi:hypothetical protein
MPKTRNKPRLSTLEIAEKSLDAAEIVHDGISDDNTPERCIYVPADLLTSNASAAFVLTPKLDIGVGATVTIELMGWDASGGLEDELYVGDVRPDLVGVVVKEFIRTRSEADTW